MMAEHDISQFADKVMELIPVIMREYVKHQVDEFDKLKITMPQFFVLELVNRQGEAKMSDLAKFVNVTTAAMTGIVGRLFKNGYVLRASEPGDRRIINIKLTAKGAKVVKDMMQRRKDITIRMFGSISPEEREEYLNILTHVHEHMKES
jgi:DNA-binding MarR family transcriptional regulator